MTGIKTHPGRVPAQRLEVRPSWPAHRNVGVQTGAKDAGQERDVAAVAVARIAPIGERQAVSDISERGREGGGRGAGRTHLLILVVRLLATRSFQEGAPLLVQMKDTFNF